MEKTRLSKYLDIFSPKVKPLFMLIAYAGIFTVFVLCFNYLMEFAYYLAQAHSGIGELSYRKYELYHAHRIAINVSYFLAFLTAILYLHFLRKRFIIFVGLSLTTLAGIDIARKIGLMLDMNHQLSELMPNFFVFALLLLILMFIVPFLMKRVEVPGYDGWFNPYGRNYNMDYICTRQRRISRFFFFLPDCLKPIAIGFSYSFFCAAGILFYWSLCYIFYNDYLAMIGFRFSLKIFSGAFASYVIEVFEAWIIFVISAVAMIFYFKKKKLRILLIGLIIIFGLALYAGVNENSSQYVNELDSEEMIVLYVTFAVTGLILFLLVPFALKVTDGPVTRRIAEPVISDTNEFSSKESRFLTD